VAAIAVGIPLGLAAAKLPRAAQTILGVVGMIQTVPSLALFAFLIALVGTIGADPVHRPAHSRLDRAGAPLAGVAP